MADDFYNLKERLIPICEKYHLNKVYIFGSYARGEQTKNSDINIILEPEENLSFDEYTKFEEQVEDLLQKDVDVIFIDHINPYMKETILNEAVVIFEKQ